MLPLLAAALLVPVVAGFALGGPALGFLLGGLSAAVLIFIAARSRPRDPIAPGAVEAGDPVLAVAIAPIEQGHVVREIAEVAARSSKPPRVLVLAPVEPSAPQRWLSLRGTTRDDAQAKLDLAIERLEALSCEVDGEIVDEDPARAVADQAAVHGAAAIVFVVPEGDDLGDEIEKIRSRTDRPVQTIEV